LGRAFDLNATSDQAALRVGVTQFKIDFTSFRNWFNAEPWINQNSLVAVAAGMDGLSGFRRDGGWAALRDEITRFSQIILSARPAERDFWLGLGTEEDRRTVDLLGGTRPCLHGSDAHSMERLFLPDGDRFCWIKADPTFEGLRQVLYEPKDRVHIGPSAPDYHDEARVIRSLALSKSNGWFEDVTIPLNSGLVSIIGQKGSGKSALAELTAYAAGSCDGRESGSFLHRAGKHLEDLTIALEWADARVSELNCGSSPEDSREIRYLSQKFVERLCAEDHVGEELIREIEAVIFAYIDPTDTLNASDFNELRFLKTQGVKDDGERLRDDIVRLIREECVLRDAASKLSEKRQRIKTLQDENENLTKQLPKAATAEEAQLQAALQTKRTVLASLQQASATDKQKLQKVSDIRTRVASAKSQLARFATEIGGLLDEAGIPEPERTSRPFNEGNQR
jgi:hypothetical protein